MTQEDVMLALRTLRLLRRGTMQPPEAPAAVKPFLAGGLGPACDEFAAWVHRSVADPRAAEAAIRFFGLGRLPESLERIGAGLGPYHVRSWASISSRQVARLVSQAVTSMARCGISGASATRPPTHLVPPSLHDPFPPPHEPRMRRWMIQVVVWAWAQVPAGDLTAAAALLSYEYEHGLRDAGPVPSSRAERQRWRRLAWSVLEVANHRATLAATVGRPDGSHEQPGTPLLAVSADDTETDGLAAFTAACADSARLADPDLALAALELVRNAVREGRHEAPELLGLLRDAAAVQRTTPRSVPVMLESKLIALSAIVAREQRDAASGSRGRAWLRRINEILHSPSACSDHASWAWHVEGMYRTSQELADLYVSLGRFADARWAAGTLRAQIQRFGDPDPAYLPQGWQWNLLVTEASINRHIARGNGTPEPWRRSAAVAAQRAADLGSAMGLPTSWAIAAENEITAVALDRLASSTDNSGRFSRSSRQYALHLQEATWRLRQLDRLSQQVTDRQNRATRSALLQSTLLAWRLALLQADPAAIQDAQAKVLQFQTPRAPLLPAEAEAISRYQAASASKLRHQDQTGRSRSGGRPPNWVGDGGIEPPTSSV